MNEQQLKAAFMQYLQEKSGAQTQQEFEAYIQQLGEEGLQQEYAQFMEMMKQQQVSKNKFGGMLNYIGKLRGMCPEGYEMQFFKQGGQICKKCVQKAKMEEGGKTPKDPIDAFRCGRKMKKQACGGSVEKDKCGNKMKKKACGGPVKKEQAGGPLPTAEPANKRYKGGTYVGPRKNVFVNRYTGTEQPFIAPQTETITGPNQAFTSPARMTLNYNPTLGDSTITEVPTPFEHRTGSWWQPSSVKVQPRTAGNKGGNPQEWQVMKKRWEQAKKVTR